jgi:hypothetical protein
MVNSLALSRGGIVTLLQNRNRPQKSTNGTKTLPEILFLLCSAISQFRRLLRRFLNPKYLLPLL